MVSAQEERNDLIVGKNCLGHGGHADAWARDDKNLDVFDGNRSCSLVLDDYQLAIAHVYFSWVFDTDDPKRHSCSLWLVDLCPGCSV